MFFEIHLKIVQIFVPISMKKTFSKSINVIGKIYAQPLPQYLSTRKSFILQIANLKNICIYFLFQIFHFPWICKVWIFQMLKIVLSCKRKLKTWIVMQTMSSKWLSYSIVKKFYANILFEDSETQNSAWLGRPLTMSTTEIVDHVHDEDYWNKRHI